MSLPRCSIMALVIRVVPWISSCYLCQLQLMRGEELLEAQEGPVGRVGRGGELFVQVQPA